MVRSVSVLCVSLSLVATSTSAQEPAPPGPSAETDLVALGARPRPVGIHGYPPVEVDQEGLVELLRKGRFTDLEDLFRSLEAGAAADITREIELEASYRSFYGSDAAIEGRLDEWVASDPESDASRVARAQFYLARAWEARGEGVMVPNASAVRRFVEMAAADVGRALDLDPDNLGAYSTALRVHRILGWSGDAAAMTEIALARFPTSYWLRWMALGLMEPRWGGSYELMNRFAADAQQHVAANPRLASLRGTALIEEAATLSMNREYDASLAKLEEARRFGTDWDFYYQRGRTLFHHNQAVNAVAVLDSAIAIQPISEDVLEYRGWALYWAARREATPAERVPYLQQAVAELVDATKRSQADPDLSDVLSDAISARARCTTAPVDCFDAIRREAAPVQQGPWWWRLVVFVVSLPYTLYMVFVDGERLHMLPAPLLGVAICLWSFREWRRQRYWTPRIVHIMAALALVTIALINVQWVRAGGEMWTQRYVVIAIFGIFPYVAYLLFLGPKYLGRRHAPGLARPRPTASRPTAAGSSASRPTASRPTRAG